MAFEIWNRRYTGSKYKLSDWIVGLINENCNGTSFCDLFAGTGVVSEKILPFIEAIHINDFLYSNEVIYQAFFLPEEYSIKKINKYKAKYQALNPNSISENYVSTNFGGKFFSENDS